jgi:hypothetical protein
MKILSYKYITWRYSSIINQTYAWCRLNLTADSIWHTNLIFSTGSSLFAISRYIYATSVYITMSSHCITCRYLNFNKVYSTIQCDWEYRFIFIEIKQTREILPSLRHFPWHTSGAPCPVVPRGQGAPGQSRSKHFSPGQHTVWSPMGDPGGVHMQPSPFFVHVSKTMW